MYDAYGKFPQEAYLSGNFWSIGSPHSCMEVKAATPDPAGEHPPFAGKYCLVQPFPLPANGTELLPGPEQEARFRMKMTPEARMPPTLSPGDNVIDSLKVSGSVLFQLI